MWHVNWHYMETRGVVCHNVVIAVLNIICVWCKREDTEGKVTTSSISQSQWVFPSECPLCNCWHPLTFIWLARLTALIQTPITKSLMASLRALRLAQTCHTFSSKQWQFTEADLLKDRFLNVWFVHFSTKMTHKLLEMHAPQHVYM